MLWIWLALAGALGAVSRVVADEALARRVTINRAVTITMINVAGAFAAGVVASVVVARGEANDVVMVLSAGFLGAFTTFSTAMMHVAERLHARDVMRAVRRAVVPVGAATAGAWLGFVLGASMVG